MSSPLRELDHRSHDGIDVQLLWDPSRDRVLVAVSDAKTGEAFTVPVPRGPAPVRRLPSPLRIRRGDLRAARPDGGGIMNRALRRYRRILRERLEGSAPVAFA